MRGCFSRRLIPVGQGRAFPAYAGMFLADTNNQALASSFPRVCGDVSRSGLGATTCDLLSPRMRGCFREGERFATLCRAFPAYAGMFPISSCRPLTKARFPRVCGDVSATSNSCGASIRLSPRMRGCFRALEVERFGASAFPAYAGMFPRSEKERDASAGFPRVCGDVSPPIERVVAVTRLSPRMRGCFSNRIRRNNVLGAFPAYAGMFPR